MDAIAITPVSLSYNKLNLQLLEKCKKGDFEAFEQAKLAYAFSKQRAVKIQLKLFFKQNPYNVVFKFLEVFYQINNYRYQKAKQIWEYTIKQLPEKKPAIYYYTKGALDAGLVLGEQLSTTVQSWEKDMQVSSRKLNWDVYLQFVLASNYYHGEGIEQNLEKAKAQFLDIVTYSFPAIYKIARIAQKENQLSKAQYWYKFIASSIPYPRKLDLDQEWCHVKAHYGLGELYLKKGESSVTDAEWHYFRAAEAGHPQAQYRLGAILLARLSLSLNGEPGISWIQKAAVQGLQEAKELLKTSI